MRTQDGDLRFETLIWEPEIEGRTHNVPVSIQYTGAALAEGSSQTHLYLGLGEEETAGPLGLEVARTNGIDAVNVIYRFEALPCTRANIERTVIEVPHMVSRALNERAGNPADTPVDLMGSSQGGGGVIMTASEAPEKFGAIATLGPVGLTPEAFGDHPFEKKARFMWRLAVVNGLLRPENTVLRDRGNWEALRAVGGRAVKDIVSRRLGPKLDFALSQSLATDVARLATDHDIAIFATTKDPVFRIHELRAALEGVGASSLLHEIPGPHATVFNRAGRTALSHAVGWLYDAQQARDAVQDTDTV